MALRKFVKQNIVVFLAWMLAAFSIFFVPFDREYLGYFDIKTLFCLFSIMLIVSAYKNINVFAFISKSLIKKLKNTRFLTLNLVMLTFFSSMFIANDTALLTFLPLTILVFKQCDKESYIPVTVVLKNIAANLGGMLLPFGNPQSLYLYSYYDIGFTRFLSIMALPFFVSLVIILIICFTIKKEEVSLCVDSDIPINKPKTIIFGFLFLLTALSVFNIIPYLIVTPVVLLTILFADKKSFKNVDFGLLLTFVAFFIFASNLSRLGAVQNFVTVFINKSVLLTGVVCCQLFSNVPTAIFLSKFTTDYTQLLLSVNIGGTGTLVASLASLISFKIFSTLYPKKTLSYIRLFLLYNFFFLLVLILVSYLSIHVII